MEWVHTRFEHDPEHRPSRCDPLTILREAPVERRFTCRESAILLASALQCVGHPARVIAALRDHYHSGMGKGHWLVEVWSDEPAKWIVLDPQNNCLWRRGDEVLNAAELRHALINEQHDGIAAWVGDRAQERLLPGLEQFRVLWFYLNQDYFGQWDALGAARELAERPQILFQGIWRRSTATPLVLLRAGRREAWFRALGVPNWRSAEIGLSLYVRGGLPPGRS